MPLNDVHESQLCVLVELYRKKIALRIPDGGALFLQQQKKGLPADSPF
jgi:hypothetical protein